MVLKFTFSWGWVKDLNSPLPWSLTGTTFRVSFVVDILKLAVQRFVIFSRENNTGLAPFRSPTQVNTSVDSRVLKVELQLICKFRVIV